MFGNFFGKKDKTPTRVLNNPEQLQMGDIVEFSDSLKLPEELRNSSLEVTSISTYQYEDGQAPCFMLRDSLNNVVSLTIDNSDGEQLLCLGKEIPEKTVLTLFSADDFASIWEEQQAHLSAQQQPDELQGWITTQYHQSNAQEGTGFFYKADLRGQTLSHLKQDDDNGEEFRYFECEGADDRYGISIETWSDGKTDVSLEVNLPYEIIENLWPKTQ
jgi:hypothetical protein